MSEDRSAEQKWNGIDFEPCEIVRVRMPISAVFEPKGDITAYELAQMMPAFHGRQYFAEEWDALPSWTRHWRRVDK
jgi:hypothetical protein